MQEAQIDATCGLAYQKDFKRVSQVVLSVRQHHASLGGYTAVPRCSFWAVQNRTIMRDSPGFEWKPTHTLVNAINTLS